MGDLKRPARSGGFALVEIWGYLAGSDPYGFIY
jgi:hypothetical protein